MTNVQLYNSISSSCSKSIAKNYSTSFYSAIKFLHKKLHEPICHIYGFVRLADEIVDSFDGYNQQHLFENFSQQTYDAIAMQISLNPVLQSFQQTVNEYKIDIKLIDAFLYSMQLDLTKKNYSQQEYETYIYGSAEAVGLMCLQVFCNKDISLYNELLPYAKKLGSAFQKVNFLRDLKADNETLQRMYFPDCNFKNFTVYDKISIEKDIQADFDEAFTGIKKLPKEARFGVYLAYEYYLKLFRKIKTKSSSSILQNRIRIADYVKAIVVANASIKYKLNMY